MLKFEAVQGAFAERMITDARHVETASQLAPRFAAGLAAAGAERVSSPSLPLPASPRGAQITTTTSAVAAQRRGRVRAHYLGLHLAHASHGASDVGHS